MFSDKKYLKHLKALIGVHVPCALPSSQLNMWLLQFFHRTPGNLTAANVTAFLGADRQASPSRRERTSRRAGPTDPPKSHGASNKHRPIGPWITQVSVIYGPWCSNKHRPSITLFAGLPSQFQTLRDCLPESVGVKHVVSPVCRAPKKHRALMLNRLITMTSALPVARTRSIQFGVLEIKTFPTFMDLHPWHGPFSLTLRKKHVLVGRNLSTLSICSSRNRTDKSMKVSHKRPLSQEEHNVFLQLFCKLQSIPLVVPTVDGQSSCNVPGTF